MTPFIADQPVDLIKHSNEVQEHLDKQIAARLAVAGIEEQDYLNVPEATSDSYAKTVLSGGPCAQGAIGARADMARQQQWEMQDLIQSLENVRMRVLRHFGAVAAEPLDSLVVAATKKWLRDRPQS